MDTSREAAGLLVVANRHHAGPAFDPTQHKWAQGLYPMEVGTWHRHSQEPAGCRQVSLVGLDALVNRTGAVWPPSRLCNSDVTVSCNVCFVYRFLLRLAN